MTKQEIKDLIATKIAGQGSAVDVGDALPVILNEILDLADSGGGMDIPEYIFNENQRNIITLEQYEKFRGSTIVKINGKLFVKVVPTIEMAEGLVDRDETLSVFQAYMSAYSLYGDGEFDYSLMAFCFDFLDGQEQNEFAVTIRFQEG